MRKFNIDGMSCAACVARVEKEVSGLENVTACNVSLLTNSMSIEGGATDEEIIEAVKKAGYSASVEAEPSANPDKKAKNESSETKKLLKIFGISAVFCLVLMYFSMGYTMWSFPLPIWLKENPIVIAIIQAVLSLIVMIINKRFFVNAVKSIKSGGNMGTLVSLGSLTSYVYSLVKLFTMIGMSAEDGTHVLHELYFESAAMILTLITLGKTLEAYSKGKTTNALKALMDLSPKTATVIRDGKEQIIPASEVVAGDIFIVRAGGAIPTDGEIIEGATTVNESALTGESMPVSKEIGSPVYCATINGAGFIKCRATKASHETLLQEIIKTVKDASSTKAPVQKIADRVSGIFVPTVIIIAVATALIHLIFTDVGIGIAIERGVSVLLISCPCALGLATPVAIMVGSGVGAKNGILFKNATALEEAGKVKVIALDKTGTITEGTPSVTDILPYNISEDELLTLAYSSEKPSEHPLSLAIAKMGEEKGIIPTPVVEFQALSGLGIEAKLENLTIFAGNKTLILEKCEIPNEFLEKARELALQGKTPLFFARNTEFIGIIAVADRIKEDSIYAVEALKKQGLRVVMITGDNEITAKAIARQVGIDEVISGVLPTGKGEAIKALSENGRIKVAMVGDGINDAPALTQAHVGIAIGGGADIAIDSADIVLTKTTLIDVCTLIKLSRKALLNIKENLFWAFFYNIIGIPLAAGVIVSLGFELNPMFGAFAMSLSSFFVVMNALRLNIFKPYKIENHNEITLKVKGMMCEHCEATVKNALEALPEVAVATPSHKKCRVIITLNDKIEREALIAVIESKGYKVTK